MVVSNKDVKDGHQCSGHGVMPYQVETTDAGIVEDTQMDHTGKINLL